MNKKHGYNVSVLVRQIGLTLGLSADDLRLLSTAGKYHDIGKKALLQKRVFSRGKFSLEEFKQMQDHALLGGEMLDKLGMDEKVISAVKHHHERWDGKGYPDGLKGSDIPLFARIISIADTYDVMTSGRSYQRAVKPIIALSEIIKCSGTQFDPEIVKAFLNSFKKGEIANV